MVTATTGPRGLTWPSLPCPLASSHLVSSRTAGCRGQGSWRRGCPAPSQAQAFTSLKDLSHPPRCSVLCRLPSPEPLKGPSAAEVPWTTPRATLLPENFGLWRPLPTPPLTYPSGPMSQVPISRALPGGGGAGARATAPRFPKGQRAGPSTPPPLPEGTVTGQRNGAEIPERARTGWAWAGPGGPLRSQDWQAGRRALTCSVGF